MGRDPCERQSSPLVRPHCGTRDLCEDGLLHRLIRAKCIGHPVDAPLVFLPAVMKLTKACCAFLRVAHVLPEQPVKFLTRPSELDPRSDQLGGIYESKDLWILDHIRPHEHLGPDRSRRT